MASTSDRVGEIGADVREQIRDLRDQVERLMHDRVTPTLADAAGRAQDAVHQAQEMVEDQAEAFSSRVREMPITAVLIAAAAGYLLGRFTR